MEPYTLMPDIFVPIRNLEWTPRTMGGERILLPRFLAEHHTWWDYWERERFDSMRANLHCGDCLFDVGSEQGYMSVVYARFVGAENMVLFEPVPQVWVNAKAIWERNGLAVPRATFCGFVGAESATPPMPQITYSTGYDRGWPHPAYGEDLLDATKYRYLHEESHATQTISIDDFVFRRSNEVVNRIARHMPGQIPRAITIDVEGFEAHVLRGARDTLRLHRPLVWVSIHPDMARDRAGSAAAETHEIMKDAGYKEYHLATDHEEHWLFWHESQDVVFPQHSAPQRAEAPMSVSVYIDNNRTQATISGPSGNSVTVVVDNRPLGAEECEAWRQKILAALR